MSFLYHIFSGFCMFPGFECFLFYKAKLSGERLQHHWSSGLTFLSLPLQSERQQRSNYFDAFGIANMSAVAYF